MNKYSFITGRCPVPQFWGYTENMAVKGRALWNLLQWEQAGQQRGAINNGQGSK